MYNDRYKEEVMLLKIHEIICYTNKTTCKLMVGDTVKYKEEVINRISNIYPNFFIEHYHKCFEVVEIISDKEVVISNHGYGKLYGKICFPEFISALTYA